MQPVSIAKVKALSLENSKAGNAIVARVALKRN
jgi:hypothetical protein